MQTLIVKTERRTQLLDVTAQVQKAVAAAKISKGICYLYVPHTTAGIAINECADPDVARDIEGALDRREPDRVRGGGAAGTWTLARNLLLRV
jgi:secondary thiamine-phosphate synthase enzyme